MPGARRVDGDSLGFELHTYPVMLCRQAVVSLSPSRLLAEGGVEMEPELELDDGNKQQEG